MDFEEVYKAYIEDVYRYVLSLCHDHLLAEDVCSETFLKALGSITTFRGDCSLRVWLCQIAKNTLATTMRRSGRAIAIDTLPVIDDLPEAKMLHKERTMEIHRALHRLHEPYKEVFSLRVFSDLSYAEIAALFAKSEGWARVTFHRARKMLREGIDHA